MVVIPVLLRGDKTGTKKSRGGEQGSPGVYLQRGTLVTKNSIYGGFGSTVLGKGKNGQLES